MTKASCANCLAEQTGVCGKCSHESYPPSQWKGSWAASFDTLETQTTGPLRIETDELWTEGRKDDQGKDPWHLIPWDAMESITAVLAFGANKYSERNWEKGMNWGRVFRAAIGHLTAWFLRRGPDKETGLSHLAHAGCCVLFLIAYELRGVGNDNRPV